MKKFSVIVVAFALTLVIAGCASKKEMTPEDFIKIQTEFLSSDMSDDAKAKISQKFGFTADQYNAFEEKVESDIQLKTKVGEIRLKQQK